MIPVRPRRLPLALLCLALSFPTPALAALALDAAAARVELPGLAPAAAPLASAPSLNAAPELLAAPALPALSPASAPEAAIPAPAALPASAPAAAPAAVPAPRMLARARSGLRSAAAAFHALAYLTISAMTPGKSPALPVESYLRENQDYASASRRASLGDGAVVEARVGRAPYRIGLSHPGLQSLFDRVDAAKARGLDEGRTLAEIRSAVRASLPRAPDIALKADEKRAALSRKAVELGSYAERGRGSDDESALLAHLALQRAGFKPKLARVSAWRREGASVVDEERTLNLIHTARGQVTFDSADARFDGAKLQELTAARGAAGRNAGIAAELDGPRVFSPAGKIKTAGVEAKVSGARDLTFAVVGRSAADRLFKEDEKNYQAASPDQPVAVEWLFFPFYMDGHTALRVGDQVFEFRRKGWRTQSARAFLFNNPFFDAQRARHPRMEMPPFSFGTPLSVRKSEAAAFVAEVRAMEDAGRGWFSFWFNNCNQVPFAFLKKAGVELAGGAYTRFSSIRSYRTLLLHPPAQAGAPRLYPLPSQSAAAEPLGAAVPRYLVEERSALRDALLFLWSWPQFARQKLAQRLAPKS